MGNWLSCCRVLLEIRERTVTREKGLDSYNCIYLFKLIVQSLVCLFVCLFVC